MHNKSHWGEAEFTPRVGYAFVVPQRLGKVYPPRRALAEGTIFPELNISIHDYTRGIWNGK
ncbi:MAG: spore coat associated protein CotJA [Oscillospiraceae bacterium]|nr:spore coat associated protein CotJA [Oscillospiraceae bacterium]